MISETPQGISACWDNSPVNQAIQERANGTAEETVTELPIWLANMELFLRAEPSSPAEEFKEYLAILELFSPLADRWMDTKYFKDDPTSTGVLIRAFAWYNSFADFTELTKFQSHLFYNRARKLLESFGFCIGLCSMNPPMPKLLSKGN